jgi:starch synthase
LRDTITPWPGEDATGFIFTKSETRALLETIREAVAFWTDNSAGRLKMIRRGMRREFTWDKACREYMDIYRTIRLRL